MVNRRNLTRVTVSSDDEDEAPRPPRTRKRLRLLEEEEDEDDYNNNEKEGKQLETKEEVPESSQLVKDATPISEDATPIGEPIRFSRKGKYKRSHYESFMFNGIQYTLEDSVLFFPDGGVKKPYVAIIKDITQGSNGHVVVTRTMVLSSEEAAKKVVGTGNYMIQESYFIAFIVMKFLPRL
ncbi:hypothetical protein ACSQ67_003709 [Phaseolus vulgaris]